MRFRTVPNRGRKLSAYGLFSSHPDHFSAVLEAPQGQGRQFLVSTDGEWQYLDPLADMEAGERFFFAWKRQLQSQVDDSPAIRCLFYAAYEAGGLIERLPPPKTVPEGPLLAVFYPAASLCFDADQDEIYLAAGSDARLDELQGLLDQAAASAAAADLNCVADDCCGSDETAYKQAVECVKAYISAGDVFQANIARFWEMPFADSKLQWLYANLRRVNPAPFGCFARIPFSGGQLTIVSASPERLFRIDQQGQIDTRPIAGTRRRGEGDQDSSLRAELLLSEKERAEHIMLVDLERNDLGRVCTPGSVRVDECMVIEQYATVQHIVSNVSGQLAEGMDVVDAFRAMFPGGTITGCPKIRCMQIIHELEPRARGPYTGGIGYVAWNGAADMNILIRTFWHLNGKLHWAAGAGIVADSEPEHELAETGYKAEGLLRAFAGSRGAG